MSDITLSEPTFLKIIGDRDWFVSGISSYNWKGHRWIIRDDAGRPSVEVADGEETTLYPASCFSLRTLYPAGNRVW